MNRFHRFLSLRAVQRSIFLLLFTGSTLLCTAQQPEADTLILSNGDVLHGKLVNAVAGKVTFHNDALGDVTLPWSKIKELHTAQKFAVLNKDVKIHGKKQIDQIPQGSVDVENQAVQVHETAKPATVPVGEAAYIIDEKTLDQQVNHEPNFFEGWNGAATAGATIVSATQNQFTASGSVGLVRAVPGVTWLTPRNRTLTDFSGSFGKITQPGTPSVKTAIFHADAERDEYFSERFFGLGQVAFDHNFAQALALQSTYGGGIGYTVFSTPQHELDLKATIQYESQQFLIAPGGAPAPSNNLIGSTFSLNYMAKWKLFNFTQQAAFVPAYNQPHAYSANETNAVAFPVYKNFSFSMGTLDSYLNDPPTTVPPTKRNSFQFTTGITYAIKSKY